MSALAEATESNSLVAIAGLAIALGGVVLAGLSLWWQYLTAERARPELRVLRRDDVRVVVGGTGSTTFRVVVINVGPVGTSVEDVGITVIGMGDVSVQLLRDSGVTVQGPDLPTRIGAYDAITWRIDASSLYRGLGNAKNFGWAHQYVRPDPESKDELKKVGLLVVKSEVRESHF